jgi:hypothetical protein
LRLSLRVLARQRVFQLAAQKALNIGAARNPPPRRQPTQIVACSVERQRRQHLEQWLRVEDREVVALALGDVAVLLQHLQRRQIHERAAVHQRDGATLAVEPTNQRHRLFGEALTDLPVLEILLCLVHHDLRWFRV